MLNCYGISIMDVLSVLLGPQEVMLIVVMTAVVVFIITRRSGK